MDKSMKEADSSLEGRCAIITGASRGLGRVMAPRFARAGCRVAVHYYSGRDSAEKVAESINKSGGEAIAVQADVSDEDQVKKLFEEVVSRFAAVDILINNARIDPYKRPPGLSEGDWFDRVIGVSLKGAYLCALEAFEIMKNQRWGRIVNVSSQQGVAPSIRFELIPYGIAKTGMLNISRSLARAGAEYGVTVNTLAPGLIITENLMKRLDEEQLCDLLATIPLNRGASMEEVAEAALFCARAGFMTGETMNLNGGAYMP
jgi:3-oxoacyl-[acyl-carrier protein] reductase